MKARGCMRPGTGSRERRSSSRASVMTCSDPRTSRTCFRNCWWPASMSTTRALWNWLMRSYPAEPRLASCDGEGERRPRGELRRHRHRQYGGSGGCNHERVPKLVLEEVDELSVLRAGLSRIEA